jgi:hypothetical protein
MLSSKKDKQEFDELFDNVKLYTSYLRNASNPIPLESIFMGVIFHNYKQFLKITKEDNAIDERTLEYGLTPLLETKHEGKVLFYRFSKKWNGFLYSLHKEDRLILLKMILDLCSYNENVSKVINRQDFQSPIDYLFFLLSILLEQKRMDVLKGKNKDVTFLGFMYKK